MPLKYYTTAEMQFFTRNGIMIGSLTGPRAKTKFERPVKTKHTEVMGARSPEAERKFQAMLKEKSDDVTEA